MELLMRRKTFCFLQNHICSTMSMPLDSTPNYFLFGTIEFKE